MMNGNNMNFEHGLSDWHEGYDEDYLHGIDAELGNSSQQKQMARSRIEAMREQKALNDMLYDVFEDPDELN